MDQTTPTAKVNRPCSLSPCSALSRRAVDAARVRSSPLPPSSPTSISRAAAPSSSPAPSMTTVAASSSTGQTRNLPLIPCPNCNVQVQRCVSKNSNVYYRCPRNVLNDDTCDKYWFEDSYVSYLMKHHPDLLGTSSDVQGMQWTERMGQPTDGVKMMLMELKFMAMELKIELKDVKDELKKANGSFWGVNGPVIMCMFVALVLAMLWKK